MVSFFPRDVLDEILNLIESVSEAFTTFSYKSYQDAIVISSWEQYIRIRTADVGR